MIENFIYGVGDFSLPAKRGRPPVVKAGQSLTFTNLDATPAIDDRNSAYHTITSCKAPCTASTGIAYPIADAKVQFDSGELGYGPVGRTPAANRNTWQTPKSLKPGHLHLLLPDPPVHAGRVPGRQELGSSASLRSRKRRSASEWTSSSACR